MTHTFIAKLDDDSHIWSCGHGVDHPKTSTKPYTMALDHRGDVFMAGMYDGVVRIGKRAQGGRE